MAASGEPHAPLGHHLWPSFNFKAYCDVADDRNCTTAGGFQPDFLFRDYVTRLINVLLWISLISITALLLRKLTGILRLWTQAKLIPGPPCPSSFYGHSKLISGSNLTGEFVLSIFKFFVNNWLSGQASFLGMLRAKRTRVTIPITKVMAPVKI